MVRRAEGRNDKDRIWMLQAEELLRLRGFDGVKERSQPGVSDWAGQARKWLQQVPASRRDGPPVGRTRAR